MKYLKFSCECRAQWTGRFTHGQRAVGAHWTGKGWATESVSTFPKSERPLTSAGNLRSPARRLVTILNELYRKEVITSQRILSICYNDQPVIIAVHCKDHTKHINELCGLRAGLFNPLKPELNPICYLLALLGAHHFLHVSRIRVRSLTLRRLMSYIYIWSTHSWCF